MKLYYSLVPALIGVSVAFVQPQNALALSSVEVGKVAKAITVEISNPNGSGTGVIIKREGNIYTVLTAKHVVEAQAQYEIVTPEGTHYPLNYTTVKKLPSVDLAVVQFTSNQSYSVAKVGNSDSSTEGSTAYVAGFPQISAAISTSIYNFTNGQITANASKPLRDGYALVYSNDTLAGMSGGPVLNDQGELIGIHGRSDTTENFKISDKNPNVIIKTGFNLGIPINTFLRLSSQAEVNVGVNPPSKPIATAPKADDFFIQGVDKYLQADYQGANADFTQAIRLNANYAPAYLWRADTRTNIKEKDEVIAADYQKAANLFFAQGNKADGYRSKGDALLTLKDNQGAITAFTEAIKLNSKNAIAYNERGRARMNLNDLQGAIADFTQTIQINPKYIDAYVNRGGTRYFLRDFQGAIEDLNQSLRLAPNSAYAYQTFGFIYRDLEQQEKSTANFQKAADLFFKEGNKVEAYTSQANIRLIMKDYPGAIASFTQVIQLNPKEAGYYLNRGYAHSQLGDEQAAINDYSQAIKINPNFADAYINRGFIRAKLGDKQGAIEDYNQAIKINPNLAQVYNNRGFTRAELGDKQGALADYQKAANLYQKQGNTDLYQRVMESIKKLQQ